LLYGTHSQLHSMQKLVSGRWDQGHLWQKQVVLCIMDDGAPFCCLEWAKTYTYPGLLFGVQSQNGLCGATFCVGSKSPRGVFFMGTRGPWGEAKCRPKYGIARPQGFTWHENCMNFYFYF
jgi:hypothetical protein